jgi:hypothetical protein
MWNNAGVWKKKKKKDKGVDNLERGVNVCSRHDRVFLFWFFP